MVLEMDLEKFFVPDLCTVKIYTVKTKSNKNLYTYRMNWYNISLNLDLYTKADQKQKLFLFKFLRKLGTIINNKISAKQNILTMNPRFITSSSLYYIH